MCRVTRASFTNTTPAVVRRARSHATPVALREGPSRTHLRTPRKLLEAARHLLRSQRGSSVRCSSGPVADTGGHSWSRDSPCSPGYRCHGSDSILISLNAVSCILERRSNGRCIIDRCKTGVAHLTDGVCMPIKPLPEEMDTKHAWFGKGVVNRIPEQRLPSRS